MSGRGSVDVHPMRLTSDKTGVEHLLQGEQLAAHCWLLPLHHAREHFKPGSIAQRLEPCSGANTLLAIATKRPSEDL